MLLASGQLGQRSPLTFECYGEFDRSGGLKAVRGLFLAAPSEAIDPPHLAEAVQLRRYLASDTM